jgi:uncharacterized repeat protein (TIGR01451 family)
VRVSDPLAPSCNRTSAQIAALASMAPGASVTYTCSRPNVTQAFTNTATDTGTPPTGPNVSASDTARVRQAPFQPPPPPPPPGTPAIRIVKDPQEQSTGVGGTATFRVTVTNIGAVTLHDVTVTDPRAPNCDKDLGTMTVDQSKSYTCTWPGVPEGRSRNVASVVGTSPTNQEVRDSDDAFVVAAPFTPPSAPKIDIVKDPNIQTVNVRSEKHGSTITVISGGTAHFTIKVTNTGNVTLHDVTVTDPLSPGCNRNLGIMRSGTSKTYTCSRANVKKPYTNIAKVVGTSPTGQKVRDQDLAQVNIKTKVRVTG